MRTNDIHIAAYPKSGITYLAFLLASARAKACGLKILPTFYNIDWLVIDSHKMAGKEYGHVWNDGMGDFIKTHDSYKHVPNVIYLLRNPYDTLKSYYHFERQLGNQQSIQAFLEMRIPEWLRHVRSWLIENKNPTQSLYLIEYEEISQASLTNLALNLGFNWERWIPDAMRLASQEDMRAFEQDFAVHNPVYRRYELEFVRKDSTRKVEGFETYRELIKERCQATYCAVTRQKV